MGLPSAARGAAGSARFKHVPRTLRINGLPPLNRSDLAGGTFTLTATAFNSNGVEMLATVSWSSGTTGTATIHASTGVVTPVAAGTTLITCTAGTVTESFVLEITTAVPAVLSVTLNASSFSLTTAGTIQLNPTAWSGLNGTGSVVSGRTFGYSSSDAGVATVNASGLVTPVAAGACNIYATDLGTSVQSPPSVLTVTTAPVGLAAFDVDRAGITPHAGTGGDGSLMVRDYRNVTIGADEGHADLITKGWIGAHWSAPFTQATQDEVKVVVDALWGKKERRFNSISPVQGQTRTSLFFNTPSLQFWWRTPVRFFPGNRIGNVPPTITDGTTKWWSPYGTTPAGGSDALKYLLCYAANGSRFGVIPQNNPNGAVMDFAVGASVATGVPLGKGNAPYPGTGLLQRFGNYGTVNASGVAVPTDYIYGNPAPLGNNWYEMILNCQTISPLEIWHRIFWRRLTIDDGATFLPDTNYRWNGYKYSIVSGSFSPYTKVTFYDIKNSHNMGPDDQGEEFSRTEVLSDIDPYGLNSWGA